MTLLGLLFAAASASGMGLGDDRSVLSPAGTGAEHIARLGWPVLVGFSAVSIAVWGLLAWAALRRTGSLAEHAPVDVGGGERWIQLGGFALPALVFGVVFFAALRTLARFPMDPAADRSGVVCAPGGKAQIEVVGHRWWWEVRYRLGDSTDHFTTANEIHLPVGVPIDLDLRSADVIHSFWVPRLHGKVDLVPGHRNQIRLEASRAGVFPGSCAEFCGLQHAHMRMLVIAEPPARFEAWLAAQRLPSRPAASDETRRGETLFATGPCAACHTVRGTPARASLGPDLTHLASRSTLAAGSLPNDIATLHAWVVDAPALKPGTQMPPLGMFSGGDLHALVAYLRSLE
jgi:cytochrome c oxidase subunit 2